MENVFQNKVTLVTGAAQGIGLAAAQEFAKSGDMVVPADIINMDKQVKELTVPV